VHSLFLLELLIFSGSALAIGFWELWKTDQAIRKRKAEEAAQSSNDAPSV
jgi:hypothetical protein